MAQSEITKIKGLRFDDNKVLGTNYKGYNKINFKFKDRTYFLHFQESIPRIEQYIPDKYLKNLNPKLDSENSSVGSGSVSSAISNSAGLNNNISNSSLLPPSSNNSLPVTNSNSNSQNNNSLSGSPDTDPAGAFSSNISSVISSSVISNSLPNQDNK